MSVRLLGGMMIATGVAWWGMYEAKKLKDRVEFMKAVSSGLIRAKSQIEFGKFDIGYIFKRLAIEKDRDLFKLCGEDIKQRGIKSAWENAVNNVCEDGILKDTDKNIILQLGNTLGMSDVKGQINNIDMVVAELEKCILDAEDENTRLGKVYRGCGVLLGVFIMIILI